LIISISKIVEINPFRIKQILERKIWIKKNFSKIKNLFKILLIINFISDNLFKKLNYYFKYFLEKYFWNTLNFVLK